MGGYRKHETALYLVSWDERGMVKVGVTKCQRWRAFTLRGARLVNSWTVKDPYGIENDVRAVLANSWAPAFRDAASAAPFLGRSGAGWRECFMVPVQEAAALVATALASRTCPRRCIRSMHPHDANALRMHRADALRMHGARTDGRTNTRNTYR